MIFWVDEQISPKFADWLCKHFQVEAHSVDALGYFSTPDKEIFMKARAANAVVITKDRDFREMVLIQGTPPQVIWITCGNTSNAQLQVNDPHANTQSSAPTVLKIQMNKDSFTFSERLASVTPGSTGDQDAHTVALNKAEQTSEDDLFDVINTALCMGDEIVVMRSQQARYDSEKELNGGMTYTFRKNAQGKLEMHEAGVRTSIGIVGTEDFLSN